MPFHKIELEKLSHAVRRQIEALILQGVLHPGERLPSERDMAEQMEVSRPSLREAIADLQQAGLLVARAGSGVYVAEVLGSAFAPALVELMARHHRAVTDYLDFRKDLEGLAAERAAMNASDFDLAVIDGVFQRMARAHEASDADQEAGLDVAFHMAIIEASHNIIALHMMRSMYELLRTGVFYNRTRFFRLPDVRDALLDQHQAINDALQARHGSRARTAIVQHLDYVAAQLALQNRADENEETARLRLQHLA